MTMAVVEGVDGMGRMQEHRPCLSPAEQALEDESAVAHRLQQGLLPAASPRMRGYDFFDFYAPASQLGGDYYDYVRLPRRRLAVVVADVSGKGAAASLLIFRLSAETRYCLRSEPTPGAAVGRLNNIFCRADWEDRFVTLVLAVLDPVLHEVTIVRAGHMAPLLRRPSGAVEALAEAETDLPLGVCEEVTYAQRTVKLRPGDCVTLYTDGITEAMNDTGELYGRQRLWAQLRCGAQGVATIGRRILGDIKRFVGSHPQSDDICLACFGRVDCGSSTEIDSWPQTAR